MASNEEDRHVVNHLQHQSTRRPESFTDAAPAQSSLTTSNVHASRPNDTDTDTYTDTYTSLQCLAKSLNTASRNSASELDGRVRQLKVCSLGFFIHVHPGKPSPASKLTLPLAAGKEENCLRLGMCECVGSKLMKAQLTPGI
jgi:hypothetical protein